jgi:alkanesulfonate monooxygenase SsuD/methylene tetrahydromethanopterin reductase-like flavin-dependent oxidoreductase (luciferase family)
MSTKIGYLLPTRENIMTGDPQTGSLLDAARRAQSLGFDSIWVGDSLLARPRHDPLTLLAAVAAAVPDVELGPAVLLPALRNPVLLAHQLATLDQLSEGRLVLGVGIAGDTPAIRSEFAAAGVAFDGRVGRMMEGLRLAKQLWSGDPVRLIRAYLLLSRTAQAGPRSGSLLAPIEELNERPSITTAGFLLVPMLKRLGNATNSLLTPQ